MTALDIVMESSFYAINKRGDLILVFANQTAKVFGVFCSSNNILIIW